MRKTALIASLAATVSLAGVLEAKTIKIGIGHQSMCTDTYTAGIIVKELKLLEKHLPKTGKYKDADYQIKWADYSSGGPITNQMMASKLNIGVMGDYPLIVNGAKFQATKSLRTYYVAGTGYNLKGSGNAVVVPVASKIHKFSELKGKAISVPVGSAAWGMTLKALQDAGIKSSEVTIKNQSPAVGAANIAKGKIDAHADFCPWSELMEFRGTGRKIFDGSEAGIPYLHGVVVRKKLADEYPEVVVAFLKAVIDAGNWVLADPIRAAESLEKWTGIEKEVQYLYFSKGGHLTLEPTIKAKWIEALKFDHGVLAREKQIPPLDLKEWIQDQYIRKAFSEMAMDYDKQVGIIHDPQKAHAGLGPEVWHAKEGIKNYKDLASYLKAVGKFQANAQKLNATYVYDDVTGLKLFGKMAYYVKTKDAYKAFLRKQDAESYAKKVGSVPIDFEKAILASTS
ncbi:MAG: sulfonate ABC transporter substrate-binding protein [Rhodospirillaceae bacterium]|nr:sulfonate ABC transporter substrate-binding protein [Rhodospirillaceae bacterium]